MSPEKIAELLAKKSAPRGGGGRKKAVDYNDRSYKAWFALEHTSPDDKVFCTNPKCNDPHGQVREVPGYDPVQVVADVVTEEHGSVTMCRYCFTSEWLAGRDKAGGDQQKLAM